MNSKKTIPYFEWLRLFAAAAVVLMHTAGKHWSSVSHTDPAWATLTAWDSLVRWPVPIFVMITGALFLPRKTDLRQILRRYIPRTVAAFALWSGLCALYGLSRGAGREQTILNFVTGHYHLWYLPFLCGVYLTIPFLQKIVTDERLEKQLLVLSLGLGIFFPWACDALAALVPGWSGVVRSLQNSLNYTFFLDLLGLLLLGHWLHRREISRKTRGILYALGILGVAVTAAATLWASRRLGFQTSLFFDMKSPNTLLTAVALFVFAKYNLKTLPRPVSWAAQCSFGIYLSHALVIDILNDFGIHALTRSPIWLTPALAAAVFAISFGITAVIRKIPVFGKIFV